MSSLNKMWSNFLRSVLTNTFREFLNESMINERVNWIVDNIKSITPEKLFRNILYMMNNNPISKMAIGYKIRFLEDDYRVVFNDPFTEEFDRNGSLGGSDLELISDLLKRFEIVVNHHVELIIAGRSQLNDLSQSINELSNYYKIPDLETIEFKMIREGDLIYFMEFGQILYMVAFNQNPINGKECSDEIQSNIRENFPKRVHAMETLKERWPTGIDLKYVKSSSIF